jgi:hypothetical protein
MQWTSRPNWTARQNRPTRFSGSELRHGWRRPKSRPATSSNAVIWNGGGYHVERIKDSHRMTGTVVNEKLAERDLAALYPQKLS